MSPLAVDTAAMVTLVAGGRLAGPARPCIRWRRWRSRGHRARDQGACGDRLDHRALRDAGVGALAEETGFPILCTGDDFALTDLPVLRPPVP